MGAGDDEPAPFVYAGSAFFASGAQDLQRKVSNLYRFGLFHIRAEPQG